MTEKELFAFYKDKFQDIYADLVAIKGDKPSEIILQIESFVSHLAVANNSTDDEIVRSNLAKAQGHLQRVSLDAAKMLWQELKKRADIVYKDRGALDWCIKNKESGAIVKSMYQKAINLSIDARRAEINNVGINPEISVDMYHKAAKEFKYFLDSIDWESVEKYSTLKLLYIIKKNTVSFVLGLISGLISSAIIAVLAWKFLPINIGLG